MKPDLKISPNFTIEDIHKIREYSFEITKNMTTEERTAYYKAASDRVNQEINMIREKKHEAKT